MPANVRTVATDALATLGTIITDREKRDAIHLAVEPVIAGERLLPGEHVGLMYMTRESPSDQPKVLVASTRASTKLGIVDPFIAGEVIQGERFWLIVYPRVINSLRHVWEAPGFPSSELAQAEHSPK